mmetsp:Transcript_4790/g.10723  ORF Transcript_4790/g.10723 Transcript_4790/m.10723 type:complete len:233 (-) Transcript_4790:75-773(-)
MLQSLLYTLKKHLRKNNSHESGDLPRNRVKSSNASCTVKPCAIVAVGIRKHRDVFSKGGVFLLRFHETKCRCARHLAVQAVHRECEHTETSRIGGRVRLCRASAKCNERNLRSTQACTHTSSCPLRSCRCIGGDSQGTKQEAAAIRHRDHANTNWCHRADSKRDPIGCHHLVHRNKCRLHLSLQRLHLDQEHARQLAREQASDWVAQLALVLSHHRVHDVVHGRWWRWWWLW